MGDNRAKMKQEFERLIMGVPTWQKPYENYRRRPNQAGVVPPQPKRRESLWDPLPFQNPYAAGYDPALGVGYAVYTANCKCGTTVDLKLGAQTRCSCGAVFTASTTDAHGHVKIDVEWADGIAKMPPVLPTPPPPLPCCTQVVKFPGKGWHGLRCVNRAERSLCAEDGPSVVTVTPGIVAPAPWRPGYNLADDTDRLCPDEPGVRSVWGARGWRE